MSHLISHFLLFAALYLLAKVIRKRGSVTFRGLEGRIPLVVCLFPVICGYLFSYFGCLAIQDPDPEDRVTGWILLLLAVALAGVFLHYLTFRVVANGRHFLVRSLWRDRMIHFDRPFELKIAADGRTFRLFQGKTRAKLNWIVTGYPEFLGVVLAMTQAAEDEPQNAKPDFIR